MTPVEAAALLELLRRQSIEAALRQGPRAHGFRTNLWTLPRVARLIEHLTGVQYHPGHVWLEVVTDVASASTLSVLLAGTQLTEMTIDVSGDLPDSTAYVKVTQANVGVLATLALSPQVQAEIEAAGQTGYTAYVVSGGASWLVIDPATGNLGAFLEGIGGGAANLSGADMARIDAAVRTLAAGLSLIGLGAASGCSP